MWITEKNSDEKIISKITKYYFFSLLTKNIIAEKICHGKTISSKGALSKICPTNRPKEILKLYKKNICPVYQQVQTKFAN